MCIRDRYGKDYVKICRHKGLCDEADTAQKAIEQMEKTVMDAGWDGEWYLREMCIRDRARWSTA